jgi:hypothetical protein
MNNLPMGFGMALSQNTKAMEVFSGMTEQQQQEIIEHTHQVNSKEEMQAYVQSLSDKI